MVRARQRGMSLIELMIGVTIAALLLTLAIPSFSTAMNNRQIRTAAEAIQNGLQLARAEALRRNRTVKFQLQTGSSWLVGCQDPNDTLDDQGAPLCPTTIQARDQQEGSTKAQVATSQLLASTGALAATPVFTDTLRFTSLGLTTDDTLPAGNIARFVITNPAGGACAADGGEMRCLNVVVTHTGQIRMCDPAVAAGDMRAC